MHFLYECESNGHIFFQLDKNDNPENIVIGKLSNFDPFIKHFVRETIEAGGTVQIALDRNQVASCIFIFDDIERTGTVFTKSLPLFRKCIENVSNCHIYCELQDEIENEIFSILELDLANSTLNHSFSNEISLLGTDDIERITTAMSHIFPGMNQRWVETAIRNGDRCFASLYGDEITGLGWGSITGSLGHLISLGVLPRYRKLGIGTDLLYARLIWMRELSVSRAYSEISYNNTESRKIAQKAGFLETGKIYLYSIG
jgi:GNAT superfamily N-acetyltransferase